jgi:hypothetical protein
VTRVSYEFSKLNEEESVSASVEPDSFDCDREATTIEPLVSGQQLIESPLADDGRVNSLNPRVIDFRAAGLRCSAACFALQHACESMPAIACSAAGAAESGSPIVLRA